jgi:hypothetical protein
MAIVKCTQYTHDRYWPGGLRQLALSTGLLNLFAAERTDMEDVWCDANEQSTWLQSHSAWKLVELVAYDGHPQGSSTDVLRNRLNQIGAHVRRSVSAQPQC